MDKGVPQARQGAKNVEVRSSMDYVCIYICDYFGECIRNTAAQTEVL